MALKVAFNLGESLGLLTPATNVSMLDEKVQNFVYTEFPRMARELVESPKQYSLMDVVSLLGQALVTKVAADFFGNTKDTAKELEMLLKEFAKAMFVLAYRNSNQKDKTNDKLLVSAYLCLFNSKSNGLKKKEEVENDVETTLMNQLNVMSTLVKAETDSKAQFTPVFTIE